MTTTTVRQDNIIPIEVSWEYQLITPLSTNWVEVDDIVGTGVRVVGLNNTVAAWVMPSYKFDDIVVSYKEGGMFLITEDGLFDITTEDDYDVLGK